MYVCVCVCVRVCVYIYYNDAEDARLLPSLSPQRRLEETVTASHKKSM